MDGAREIIEHTFRHMSVEPNLKFLDASDSITVAGHREFAVISLPSSARKMRTNGVMRTEGREHGVNLSSANKRTFSSYSERDHCHAHLRNVVSSPSSIHLRHRRDRWTHVHCMAFRKANNLAERVKYFSGASGARNRLQVRADV